MYFLIAILVVISTFENFFNISNRLLSFSKLKITNNYFRDELIITLEKIYTYRLKLQQRKL